VNKKIALVTGGTGGIGTAICRELASQQRQVVAGYIPAEEELAQKWLADMNAQGIDVGIVAGDVSEFDSAGQMVAEVRERFGPVELLANCAGVTRDGTLAKMEPEQWRAVIDTNLSSIFNVTRHVLPHMIDAGFGRIVSMSSVNGQKGQFGQTNYSAAKAGVHGFTMALAQEVARKGITVNTVAPGYVKTRMTDAIPEEIRNSIVDTIPLGRMAEPEEVARLVGFLCRDDNAYITGARVPINGGMYMS
jgi:acetoacetyl-CoA reductase